MVFMAEFEALSYSPPIISPRPSGGEPDRREAPIDAPVLPAVILGPAAATA
jgi:hypothetical protein